MKDQICEEFASLQWALVKVDYQLFEEDRYGVITEMDCELLDESTKQYVIKIKVLIIPILVKSPLLELVFVVQNTAANLAEFMRDLQAGQASGQCLDQETQATFDFQLVGKKEKMTWLKLVKLFQETGVNIPLKVDDIKKGFSLSKPLDQGGHHG